MKTYFFAIISILTLFSCNKKELPTHIATHKITPNISLYEKKEYTEIHSRKFRVQINVSALPLKKIVLLNASLLGYITALNAEDRVVGISSPEYIFSQKIKQKIAQGTIADVGNEQKYNIEKIIALQPDAVFTNYIANFENTYEILKKNGIQVVFVDEYLEQQPLDKSKILLFFGKLMGKEQQAAKIYNDIEKNYLRLMKVARSAQHTPKVLSNEMYGSIWYLPGGKSITAKFIADANAQYVLQNNTSDQAVSKSFEEVYAIAQDAQFWINVGNHQSKKELLSVHANYAMLPVYQKGKMYALTAKEINKANDFFESGVVRADLVLQDYIKIFHPELWSDKQFVYMKELR